ncbi:cytochrome c [Parahaliea maris]|uniref:Cytochrome c n=1 Tax=Parahaliea maris TaxID=2716870 RepID=A0A5C8ZVU6_9GAMM|nr:c-type cytochrome [Parahaliea maris]TXS91391.1 cytochrome c [Parahaliea maris]
MSSPLTRFCLGAGVVLALLQVPFAQGREPYDDFYCTTCHGAEGRGNVGVNAPRLAGMEPWYLKRQLQKFRDGLRGTHEGDVEGRAMRPMAVKLTDERIDAVIDWVGHWPMVSAPSTLGGDTEAGARWYRTCSACHGEQAQGRLELKAPALAGQNDWYLLTQLRNFSLGYRGQHPEDAEGAAMRAATAALPDEQAMIDVITYINSLDPAVSYAGRDE